METRSGSIKDPIYYPSGSENLDASNDVESSARSSGGSQELGLDESASLKVPRKFITNWRQACDRTRDKTKDLLKRWRTVPSNTDEFTATSTVTKEIEHPGWSVHVWTTWVSRYPSDDSLTAIEDFNKSGLSKALAPIQRDKLSHFFILLDHDKDGFVTRKDFGILSERLRRFADWSWNGPEYLRLLEIEKGFASLIFPEKKNELEEQTKKIDLDDWLSWWTKIIAPINGTNYNELPFWIKMIPRIFFLSINSTGNGKISKDEISNFYSSVVGLDSDRIGKCLDIAYNSMTSNGDHPLGWPQYQLVFANFLFGRGPFGPGEHFLGMTDSCIARGNSIPFPIDYSAMNTPKDKLEVYSPHCKSSRRSVVV
ncbi:hypothetical protein HZH68_005577 [Vespula germanica]|uniref:EF-hand domain-containing protein n=1 Tax=Vespula germanica TaxID=30212 RepID=A0A834KGG7_VESGE|nr:hypothetical protein HZH68_005577 [Vespula germanica]